MNYLVKVSWDELLPGVLIQARSAPIPRAECLAYRPCWSPGTFEKMLECHKYARQLFVPADLDQIYPDFSHGLLTK